MCDAALSHLTRSSVTYSPRIPRVVAYPIMMARRRVRPSVTQRGSLLNNNKFPSVDTLDLSSPFPVPHCVPCSRDAPFFAWGHTFSPREHRHHPLPVVAASGQRDRYNVATGTGLGLRRKEGRETPFAEGKHRGPRSEQGGESKDERIAPPGD